LKFLCNDTAVTGDSSNRTVFWDLKTGTSIAEFRAHEAPVLAIETGKDRRIVYATGADSRIFEFYFNDEKKNWCQGACFYTSSPYDINCLQKISNRIMLAGRNSGNVDKIFLRNGHITQSFEFLNIGQDRIEIFSEENENLVLNREDHKIDLFSFNLDADRLQDLDRKAFKMLKSNSLEENYKHVFQYLSNDVITASCYFNSRLILATSKFLKVYKFSNSRLHEVSKQEIFCQVTSLSPWLTKREFYAGFSDGTIHKYNYEDLSVSKRVKKRSNDDIVAKMLVVGSFLVFTTYSNKLFALQNDTIEKLPVNKENIDFIRKSRNHENCVVLGTAKNLMLISLEKKIIVSSARAKNFQSTKYFDFGEDYEILVTDQLYYVDGNSEISRKTFSKKRNLQSVIIGAEKLDNHLVLIENTVFQQLKSGPEVHDVKRRKFGR